MSSTALVYGVIRLCGILSIGSVNGAHVVEHGMGAILQEVSRSPPGLAEIRCVFSADSGRVRREKESEREDASSRR
eukprot:1558903-Rhodomonas_salina.1